MSAGELATLRLVAQRAAELVAKLPRCARCGQPATHDRPRGGERRCEIHAGAAHHERAHFRALRELQRAMHVAAAIAAEEDGDGQQS
jgi:hypothetical protein